MSRVLPILFNTNMVRAILDGRKTVTRRICKDGNDFTVPDMSFYDADKRTYAVHNYANQENTEKLSLVERICPICPGDILYVRETWCNLNTLSCPCYYYKASDNLPEWALGGWKPSIHMPKKAARIWLKVTDVRVEKLWDMTLDDFLAEGVVIRPEAFNDPENVYMQARREFAEIWDSTIPKSQTILNCWVWVIEFERCEKPEEL